MQRLACMNVFKSKWIYLLFIVLISNSVRAQNAIDSLKIEINPFTFKYIRTGKSLHGN